MKTEQAGRGGVWTTGLIDGLYRASVFAPAGTPRNTMPVNVIRFQVAAYLGLLVGGVLVLTETPPAEVSPIMGAALMASIWALAAWLIHHAAEHRSNWARWTYGILVVFSAISVGFDMWNRIADAPWSVAVSAASSMLELWAVYCAFTRDAVAWFEHHTDRPPQDQP
jgi:hypothetical protein